MNERSGNAAATLDPAEGDTALLIVSGGNELRIGTHRGMALLRIKQDFRAAGLEIGSDELPDHLPVVLEFGAAHDAERGVRREAPVAVRVRDVPPRVADLAHSRKDARRAQFPAPGRRVHARGALQRPGHEFAERPRGER